MSTYKIHVTKDNLLFAAAHFASFDGDQVEPLHGHNYRVSITLEGPLDENAYVFNFVPIKRILKRLADELDHRMLLPRDSKHVHLEDDQDGGVIVRAAGRWYRFPLEDVCILPITNTTVEPIAHYLCGRLRDELRTRDDAQHLTAIEIEIEETFGQSAIYRESLAFSDDDMSS